VGQVVRLVVAGFIGVEESGVEVEAGVEAAEEEEVILGVRPGMELGVVPADVFTFLTVFVEEEEALVCLTSF
jgi:hypothetical protein